MVISAALIARYEALKAEVPDALLMMQVGAFLQVMNADARAVAALTGLKLPKRRADDRRAIRHCACATTAAGRQAGPERDPASSRTA
jgi:DNA mismatch repair ATPase MutS